MRKAHLCAAAATAAALLVGSSPEAAAQSSPAFGPVSGATSTPHPAGESGEMPLADYLALLHQIAPAAELGARDYLAAFLLRCGREMSTGELRRVFASDPADPVLTGLIRAAQPQDPVARHRVIQRLRCPSGPRR